MLGGPTIEGMWSVGGTRRTLQYIQRLNRTRLRKICCELWIRGLCSEQLVDVVTLIAARAWPLTQQHRLYWKIGGSGNMMMIDWPNKVLRIHMRNSADDWLYLCMLILSWQSQAMSASTAGAPQKWLKGPWGRTTKTQMVKGKTMPSPRLCNPRSDEAVFVVFLVSQPGRKLFRKTNLPTRSEKWPQHYRLTWRS
jgi:hypothetical protein